MFKVDGFSLSVAGQELLKEVSFSLKPGTVTVCMGANGSGKSSLANGLMGHPSYQQTAGSIFFMDKPLHTITPDKRAKAGLFLSLQYPVALPGITVNTLLKESFRALHPDKLITLFDQRVSTALEILKLDTAFLTRAVNDGFSGGEKKRCEMLQLLVLQPQVVMLDEIDSGLDIDALKIVGNALNWFMQNCPESALFIITHYQNILDYVCPDQVLVMDGGKLVVAGDASLIGKIQKDGYDQFKKA